MKTKLVIFFADMFYKIRHTYRKCIRALAYAKFGYNNYDWDYHGAYKAFSFVLKRVQKHMKTGYGKHEKESMAALIEAIKILERLEKEAYDEKYHRQHNKRWGSLRYKFEPIESNPGYSRFIGWRPKAKTKAQKAKERKEHLCIYKKADLDRRADIHRLAKLLIKYSERWWD